MALFGGANRYAGMEAEWRGGWVGDRNSVGQDGWRAGFELAKQDLHLVGQPMQRPPPPPQASPTRA